MDEDKIQITVIATGFPSEGVQKKARRKKSGAPVRLELTETDVRMAGEEQVLNLSDLPEDDMDIPSVLRRRKDQQE
jgi:hypothetical protein